MLIEIEAESILISYKLFESSRFARETGAAIHMAPNAHGLLQRLGIDMKAIGANECLGVGQTKPCF